ncbi:polymorphic toxin-type HINT domain-containing protein [Krasilnikovia sp. MM14-A1259]|uniref:polymorphic toxin-type HINT domain-containing protein n=1 Tax=Krasilnikovia sp. MM14-A1259 TaxID=3373539 RepID=UPI0037F5ABC3
MKRWRLRVVAGIAAGLAAMVVAPHAAVAAPPVAVAAARPRAVTLEQALQQLLAGQPQDKLPTDDPVDDAGLDRMLAQDLADYDEDPDVREAAKAVLATNDPAKIKDFLDNGLPVYRKAGEQRKKDQAERDRYLLQEWAETGTPSVREKAKALLAGTDDEKIAAFVATGKAAAELADKQDALSAADKAKTIRARVEQLVDQGGYEVQSLGQAALDSDDPAVIENFYTDGYKAASQHDADTQKQITEALAARSKAVDDLTDLARRATQAANAQKRIIEESITATKALTQAALSMGLANKDAKTADATYAADLPLRKAGNKTHTADLTALRTQACTDAASAGRNADQVTAHAGVAAVQAKTLQDTGLSHGIAWADVIQAQADAGTAAKQAAETACHAAEATEAAGKTLDADRNATVDADNAVKYRQAAEREQAAAEKLADRAEKLAAGAQAAAQDAHTQRLRAEKDADSAKTHADNAAGYYNDARRQRDVARAATAAAVMQQSRAYNAARHAIDQHNIVSTKASAAKKSQEESLAAGQRFLGIANRAKALSEKAQQNNENTKAKEIEAQLAEARRIQAETNCQHPGTGNGCPGTADMQKLRDDAARLKTDAATSRKAADQSHADAKAAAGEASAAAADARRAAAAAAAAAADARAAANEAALARQDAADAQAAAVKAINDANKANADARASVRAAREAINRASAAHADADLTSKAAQDAVRQSAIAAFQSRVSGRAALEARISAAGIADPAAAAIDLGSVYADTDSDAAFAIDLANNALLIGEQQATAAQKHADDAAAAATHAADMAAKAAAQVKPAYVAAQKAAEAAGRAVKASKDAIDAAREASKDAQATVGAAGAAGDAANEAGDWAAGAVDMAEQAGRDAGVAQQAANGAALYAGKARDAAFNADSLAKKIAAVSDSVTQISDGVWGTAEGIANMAETLHSQMWQAHNAEQQATETQFFTWLREQGDWISKFNPNPQISKGYIDSAIGMVQGAWTMDNCAVYGLRGMPSGPAHGDTVPDTSALPDGERVCFELVMGYQKMFSDPKQLLHWDDWKKDWQYAAGETAFDIVTIGLTDGEGSIAKLASLGTVTKATLKSIANISAKDLIVGLARFGEGGLLNAIKELGASTTARIVELTESLGGKLKVTFSPDELAAMSKAIKLKGIQTVENALRNLKDNPVIKGLQDLAKACLTRGNSFTPDTRVLLGDGTTTKPIADIRVGDHVLATDPAAGPTGDTVSEPVTDLITSDDTELTDLTVEQPDGQQAVLHTTAHHPFWNFGTRTWTEAGQLRAGATLATTHGKATAVTAVRNFNGDQSMHNLTVADLHTYYVLAGKVPILVHNCGRTVVFGVNKHSEALVAKLREMNIDAKTFNDPALAAVNPETGLAKWQELVNDAIKDSDTELHIALDGLDGNTPMAKFLNSYKLAKTPGAWGATDWELGQLGFYVRLGYRDWRSVKFYLGNKEVPAAEMPEPDWASLR